MRTDGSDPDLLSSGTTTLAQGQGTTCDDHSGGVDHAVSVDSTDAARDDEPAGEWSTIDTIPAMPETPEGTSDCLFQAFQELAQTPCWDSQQTLTRSSASTLESSEYAGPRPESMPPDSVPGFEIVSVLGRGGMGIVYKARQLRLNRLVALKMVRDDRHGNPEDMARFEIEAEAVARLDHPNILRIYQFGRARGVPFVALELLEGGSLGHRLAGTPQPVTEAATLLSTLARAVNAAHLAGILHRDLKPSNVLFDHAGVPKVADFGLAKRLDTNDGETRTGQVMGTPSYMAPEQAKGWGPEIGPAADIYSLGAILYEMLTGRPPLKGMTTVETIKLVLDAEPVPPSRLRPNIPFDLETICLKCLAKEPHRRYASADGLAQDLDRFLAGEPIRARRTPLWERGIKLARRRPGTTILLAATIVAVGTGLGMLQQSRTHERIRLAQESQRLAELSQMADQALFEAQGALAQRRWDNVMVIVSRLSSRIESEPGLAVARGKAENLREQAQRGLGEERAREQAQDQFHRFVDARDEAMFLDTRFVAFDPARTLEATSRSARDGLRVFGTAESDDDWTLRPLPDSMSADQRDEVMTGFYQLLLILADSVAQSPGAEPGQRAEQAIRIISRASELRSPATRAYHLRRSAYLDQKGDHDEAARERVVAERLAPADAFDFFLAGREQTKRSDWLAAITSLEAATQRQPDHFWAHCLLAICHLQTNEPSKARSNLNACLQRKKDSVWLYLLRGLANAQAGKVARDMARRYPDQAASLGAASSAQFEDAVADYRKALGLLGKTPEDAEMNYILRVNRGLIQYERQDLTAAAADLQEAIRLDDRRFDAFSALSQVSLRQGRTQDALDQLARAIRLRPDWAPLHRARADLLIGLKKLTPEQRDAAWLDLEDAIRHESPGSPEIAVDRTKQAALLHQAGRNEEALEACAAALEINTRYAPAHRVRIKVLLDLKRYDELIESCDVALGSMKPTAELYELRGMAREARKEFPGAIDDYTLALSIQAENPRLLLRRGWSYLAQDANRPASHDFEKVIQLVPKSGDAYNGRGFARARLGMHHEAASDAEDAFRLGDSTWRIAYGAARIYAQASAAAASEVRRTGPDAVYNVSRYQDRALALLRIAQQRAASEQRAVDFKEAVLADPALEPIRRRLRSLQGLDSR